MTKNFLIVFFILNILTISAAESAEKFTAALGIGVSYYTDMESVLTLHEGLSGQMTYNTYTTGITENISFQMLTGLKTGILWEGATSMDHLFQPQSFPVFIPLEPGIKLNCHLGENWNISLNSFFGPYFYYFNNYYLETLLNLEIGMEISWFCFNDSGFSLLFNHNLIKADENNFSGFGCNLLYIWQF